MKTHCYEAATGTLEQESDVAEDIASLTTECAEWFLFYSHLTIILCP